MTQHPPALVGISHGTSSDAGRRSVRGLHDAVAAAMAQRHPDATPPVRLGHVDVEQPDVPATLASLEPGDPPWSCRCCSRPGTTCTSTSPRPSRPRRNARSCSPAPSDPTTGSRPCCCDACDEAGLRDDDRVVLAVAGSSDRRAVDDCRDMAARLAAASGSRRLARLPLGGRAAPARRGRRPPDRMPRADGGRVVVANYLLAPGFFDDLARAAGADVTARPLLVPDEPAPRGARRDRARPLRRGVRGPRLSRADAASACRSA